MSLGALSGKGGIIVENIKVGEGSTGGNRGIHKEVSCFLQLCLELKITMPYSKILFGLLLTMSGLLLSIEPH